MSYLAYDPDRVMTLQQRMHDALTELGGISSPDAEATAAITAVRAARVSVGEVWLPSVSRVLSCDALTRAMPTQLSAHVRELLGVDDSWSVIDLLDPNTPLDGPGTLTVEEIQRIATRLASGDVDDLFATDDGCTQLIALLTLVSRHPEMAAAFFGGFPRLDELASVLAQRRVELDARERSPEDDAELSEIDATYRALTEAYTAAHGPNSFPPIDRMWPYAAAQMVRWAHLDGHAFAAVADAILRRSEHDRPSTGWIDDAPSGDHTADVIFREMLTVPGASAAYVVLAADDPTTMFWGAADARLPQLVACRAPTAPRRTRIPPDM